MDAFLEGMTAEIVKFVVGAVLVGVLSGGAVLLARGMARRGKVWIKGNAGRTCASPFILLVGLLCALAAAAFLALGLAFPEAFDEPGGFESWVGLVAAFFLGFLAILPFTRHVWEWDAAGLRWHGAWRSKSMRWADIARLGKSWDSQLFAADKSGKKIYWSTHTLEYEALGRAVQAARPDLSLPKLS